MAVDKVGFGRSVVPVASNAKIKGKGEGKSENVDRAELSEEAKSLFAAEKGKKYDEIREKVKSGFYDSPEVTQRVVDGLIRDIESPV